MKYIKFSVILFLICILMTACGLSSTLPSDSTAPSWAVESLGQEASPTVSMPLSDGSFATPSIISSRPSNNLGYQIAERKLTFSDSATIDGESNQEITSINISYPELVGFEATDIEKKINNLLRAYPLNQYLYSCVNSIEELFCKEITTCAGDSKWESKLDISVSYQVLFQDEQFLSIKFEGTTTYYRVNRGTHYLTVDLSSGKLLSLLDLCSIESVLSRLEKNDYEVVSGTYLPGGWEGYEENIKEDFRAIIKDELDDIGQQHGTMHDGLYDIGFDNEGLYMRFYYEDALDEQVVLSFPAH